MNSIALSSRWSARISRGAPRMAERKPVSVVELLIVKLMRPAIVPTMANSLPMVVLVLEGAFQPR